MGTLFKKIAGLKTKKPDEAISKVKYHRYKQKMKNKGDILKIVTYDNWKKQRKQK